mgnify:FL=1|tara:strand:+ start:841 stop:1080 length:240 start_codon:yes stop_codon:yes gene_type:complete
MESKEEKFKRLAVSRVNKTLKQIRLLGNLSNQSLYEYPDKYILQIEEAILKELKEAIYKLENRIGQQSDEPFAWEKDNE